MIVFDFRRKVSKLQENLFEFKWIRQQHKEYKVGVIIISSVWYVVP
jgi:hypothetical protein